MAAAGHPVSDLYPRGGAVSLESTLPSSTQAISPPRLAAEPGYPYQEESKEADCEICNEHSVALSTRETNSNSSLGVCGEHADQRHNPSGHCVAISASSHPQSLVETHTPSPRHQMNVNAISNNLQAGRTVKGINPASVPVHKCPSGPLPLGNQGEPPQPSDSETCGLAYHREDRGVQDAESHSMLACKQPMQLQQCNIITTICRGATAGERGVQQPQAKCVCISSPKPAAKVEGIEKKGHLPPECDKALCCGSYIHPANFEDTFAAYCHPQPIPAPSQLLPRHIEPSCDIQRAVAAPSANHLTLPRLISSVSETGLDAKHLLRCCNLSCSWINTLPPGAGTQSQKHFGLEECCSSPAGHVRTMTKDTATMTAPKELRDVGVQTGQTITPHVFPQICLAEESRSETTCSQTANSESDGGKKLGGAPKSPVKEVKWDAEGMTWEVYGASVDPEELGLAIQKHLELQIKETASRAAKLSRQNTNTSRQSRDNGSQRKRSRMISSIRTPSCCARTSTAVD